MVPMVCNGCSGRPMGVRDTMVPCRPIHTHREMYTYTQRDVHGATRTETHTHSLPIRWDSFGAFDYLGSGFGFRLLLLGFIIIVFFIMNIVIIMATVHAVAVVIVVVELGV